jgi:copper homeostasis protein
MSRLLLEVIVQTVADAREAARGGADRLEVVRAIEVGGLTPSLETVDAIARETGLPLRVMLRENPGFGTDPAELVILRVAAQAFEALGVDGLVAGFARDGALALDDFHAALATTPHTRVTFHRAYDSLHDPLDAIDRLVAIPQIDAILTSGGDGLPAARCDRLRERFDQAKGRVEIIAGGGVTEEMVALIARTGCVREVHVGRAAREGAAQDAPVSAARVSHLRRLCGI